MMPARHGAGPLSAALGAAMFALLFPPQELGLFAFLFLVPGLVWLVVGRPTLVAFLGVQAVVGWIAWMVLLSWLRHAHPLAGWLGLPLLAGAVTVFWAAWWWMAALVVPRALEAGILVRLVAVAGLAGGWVVLEWVRGWILTGFPWLPLAASQWKWPPLLQIAPWTGAAGVSFLLVFCNLAVASWFHRLIRHARSGWRRLCPEFHVAALAVAGCVFLTLRDLPAAPFPLLARVGLVQPDVPPEVKWDSEQAGEVLDAIRVPTAAAALQRPDLIVWPEAVLPFALRGDAFLEPWVESAARTSGVPILLGSVVVSDRGGPAERWTNGAFVVDPAAGIQPQEYAKRHLVPFGEYVPLRSWFPDAAKLVPIGGDFEPGASAAPLVVSVRGELARLAVLICYEDVFGGLARASVAEGADALVVLTNNGWLGRGSAAWQHMAHSVLRAVETRRPVIRAANSGWSGWIDERGNIRATLRDANGSIYFRGASVVEVRRDPAWTNRLTFYTRHGDWFVLVAAGLAALAVALTLRRRPWDGVQAGPDDGGPISTSITIGR